MAEKYLSPPHIYSVFWFINTRSDPS